MCVTEWMHYDSKMFSVERFVLLEGIEYMFVRNLWWGANGFVEYYVSAIDGNSYVGCFYVVIVDKSGNAIAVLNCWQF